ncbi:hypothetical protein BDV28DRAFT_141513 [Aspergillus coremiiformis]|uniref:Uncharacterized protein n=1 Tax=Aspergillus coremiiformis TaxID=138285 RepID=A0A5N6YUY8_9EURO|nr:hypothetical protein BDV28DRAFT_141513 [Aspergillus coremiiformis]
MRKRTEEFKSRLKVLREMERHILEKDLSNLNIQCYPMDLTPQGTPAFDPHLQFFDPLPADSLWRPIPEDEDHLVFTEDDPSDEDYPYQSALGLWDFLGPYLRSYRSSQDPESLIIYDRNWHGFCEAKYNLRRPLHHASDRTNWITVGILDLIDRRFPHIKCALLSNAHASDELLPTELLLITRLMGQRQVMRVAFDHKVIPILVLSLMGRHQIRILQAHLDGETLVVMKSKIFDLRTRDDEVFDLLAQWYLSEPVGTTQ